MKMNREQILAQLTQDNGYYECGKVNFCNLATIIEQLYSRIDELESELKNARE